MNEFQDKILTWLSAPLRCMLRLNLTHILYQVMFSISFFSADSSPSTWAGFLVVLNDAAWKLIFNFNAIQTQERRRLLKGWCSWLLVHGCLFQQRDRLCFIKRLMMSGPRLMKMWDILHQSADTMTLVGQCCKIDDSLWPICGLQCFYSSLLGTLTEVKKIPGAIQIIWKKWKTKKRIHHSKLSQDVWWKGKEE